MNHINITERDCQKHQGDTEFRIKQLLMDMEAADAFFISSQEELEMDHLDHYEANGKMYNGWFACRYDGSCSTIETTAYYSGTNDRVKGRANAKALVCAQLLFPQK